MDIIGWLPNTTSLSLHATLGGQCKQYHVLPAVIKAMPGLEWLCLDRRLWSTHTLKPALHLQNTMKLVNLMQSLKELRVQGRSPVDEREIPEGARNVDYSAETDDEEDVESVFELHDEEEFDDDAESGPESPWEEAWRAVQKAREEEDKIPEEVSLLLQVSLIPNLCHTHVRLPCSLIYVRWHRQMGVVSPH